MENPLKSIHIRAAVRNFLGTWDFELTNLSVNTVSDTPIGFMARHLQASLTVSVNGGFKKLNFFIKMLPASKLHRLFLSEMLHFQKETDFYQDLKPTMDAVLPPEYPIPVPSCYLTVKKKKTAATDPISISTNQEDEELIIMEDITEKEFRLRDKIIPFDLEHCRIFMKTLARFHAASFLLQTSSFERGKGNNTDNIDGLFLPAKEMLLSRKGQKHGYAWTKASVYTTATAAAGFWPDRFGSEEKREEIIQSLRVCWEKVFEAVVPSTKYLNVLCHGDTWVNNIMFRYQTEESGKMMPVDAILVDLQLMRFVPPAFDLLLFFHTSTRRKFREDNLKDLLSVYHRHLCTIVGKEIMDELMPWESLLACMKEFSFFGKTISTAYLPLTLNIEEVDPMMGDGDGEPPDFMLVGMKNRGEEVLANARASEMYKIRIQEGFQEILEYLNLWK